jgi:membrane peptidoglycan carboxypeptidase
MTTEKTTQKKYKKIIKIILLSLLLVILVGMSFVLIKSFQGYSLYKEVMTDVDLEEVFIQKQEEEDYTLLEDVSPTFLNALIAVEDHRFFEHKGLDHVAFLRAVMRNISEQSFAAGGSTITQQLSKNLFFSFDKTLERKIAELIVARKIEDTFNKHEILEMYINVIYYGEGYIGIKQASEGYFNKGPLELSQSESVLLAGLPQAPSVYALRTNLNRGIERASSVVLALMEHGYITEAQGQLIILQLESVVVQP